MTTQAVTKSARRNVLEAFKAAAQKVRNGSYFVKRGPINWAAFPFGEHPRAIAIVIDSENFLRQTGEAEIALELAGLMPGQGEDPSIDEGLLDEFFEDAEQIAIEVDRLRDSLGDNVALKVVGTTADHFHDSELRVQGIIAHLTVGW